MYIFYLFQMMSCKIFVHFLENRLIMVFVLILCRPSCFPGRRHEKEYGGGRAMATGGHLYRGLQYFAEITYVRQIEQSEINGSTKVEFLFFQINGL